MTSRSGTTQAPLLLMVAGGAQAYREYLLRSISTRFGVHLFDVTEPTWEREYLTGWSVLDQAMDGPAMAQVAKEVNERATISGVICWYEGRIHLAAHIAGELGLRNGDPAVIWRLRDKAQTRAALAAAGIAQPRSVPVKTLEDALAAARRVGYPAILKPRGFGASLGVVRVYDDRQLRDRFAFTRDTPWPEQLLYSTDQPVLVEECVSGEEISIDCVVQDGKVAPLFVARKVVGYPPFAEEIGHYVDAADPLLTDPDLLAALQGAHSALGFLDGWTHTEFILSPAGPQLIEVNGRLGGDMIPYLGQLATGIDPGLVTACAACGLSPDLTPSRRRVAGIRFFYVQHDDTTIASIRFDPGRLPASVERAVTVVRPGVSVSPPPKGITYGRIAFAIVVGDSIEDCRASLDAAGDALEVSSP
ncbi:MAG: ATP-grasp domain-containing protein [Streptosporangiaceae bacterium]|jgi:carbamoylphosphate synthase large subunit